MLSTGIGKHNNNLKINNIILIFVLIILIEVTEEFLLNQIRWAEAKATIFRSEAYTLRKEPKPWSDNIAYKIRRCEKEIRNLVKYRNYCKQIKAKQRF